jgi:hypothetical protein
MRDIQPREEDEAVIVRVENDTIQLWPTRQEYFLAISGRARDYFEIRGQDVETSPWTFISPSRIIIATSIIRFWTLYKDKDYSNAWDKCLEEFGPESNKLTTLRTIDALSSSCLEKFLTREDYHKYRTLIR